MNEMYLITRLDVIVIFLTILIVLSGLATICCLGWCWFEAEFEDENFPKKMYRRIKVFAIICIASCAVRVFVPTTAEMYAIIGIGGTYEYLKDNKDIKEIPDNTIKALKIWSENLLSEGEAKQNDSINSINK